MAQTKEELEADLALLRSARVTLLTGNMVKEVRRADRTMVMNAPSVDQITAEITRMEVAIAALDAGAGAAKPRFRALSIGFRA